METIWDHHPTDEELVMLGIGQKKSEYSRSQDTHYVKIAALIGIRGGSKKDQRVYLDKIQDESRRDTWLMALYEIGD